MIENTTNVPARVPEVIFKTRVRDESIGGDNPYRWQDVTTQELFSGKDIVIFVLPGAFTPICDAKHLPGYEERYDAFKELGIDEIICMSVNDAFVMNAWGKKLGISKVKLIPDGNGDFARAMGMLVKKENVGYGNRSWRYSMHVKDGEIKKAFIEHGKIDNAEEDPFELSNAETMLNYLKEDQNV